MGLVKEYGPMHYLFYVNLGIYFVFGLSVIIYCLIKKNQISNRILILLTFPEILCFLGFFLNTLLGKKVEFMPLMYVLAQIVYLFIIRKIFFKMKWLILIQCFVDAEGPCKSAVQY